MSSIPQDRSPDSTLALLREGYLFGSRRFRRYRSDAFESRLMLRPAVCTMGEEASRTFYHPGRFSRRGAMPPNALRLLQDKGSVQLLDGEEHRRRKQAFISMMSPGRVRELGELAVAEWNAALAKWRKLDRVPLHGAVQEILCRAACRWAGVPLGTDEAPARTREFAAMIDGAGTFGPRNWRGLLLRRRTERWMREIVVRLRTGQIEMGGGTALHVIASHRGSGRALLAPDVAAVEVINVLRPTVAVARYIVFAALALHDHPDCRPRLARGDEDYLTMFVQEVRRLYPFFPFVGGRVREAFDWRGRHFPPGGWFLLDLYATNHDGRTWEAPDAFRPERFDGCDRSAHNFIPQGGGDHESGHRCPGEWVTIDLMKRAVRLLTEGMRYEVPRQDLSVNLSRMPAIPKSGFLISRVRPLA